MTLALCAWHAHHMVVDIRPESYASPVARELDALTQAEYQTRYGSGDQTVLHARDFAPPRGVYVVAYLNGQAVASGAWRAHGNGDAEMKRVFVRAEARGQGIARAIVGWLEADALRGGRRRMVLETGESQPEALALYKSLGYEAVTPFGFYAAQAEAHHLGKTLHHPVSNASN